MMLQQINIFILVLSTLFLVVRIFDLTIRLFQTNPDPIKITIAERVLTYLSVSYIITNLII